MSVRAREIPLAVRGFLVRAEDFLVAVDSTNAVAFRCVIGVALLSGLRRVDEDVALLE